MKILLILTLLLPIVPTAVYSQDNAQRPVTSSWNEMWFLSGLDRVRFVLDLNDAVIDGVEAADYKETEPEWAAIRSINVYSIKGMRYSIPISQNHPSKDIGIGWFESSIRDLEKDC